jgi:lysophospholipase L1-like esterase
VASPADDEPFAFTNLTGRPTGPVVRALGTFLPGIAEVQRQVQPYAAAWREANLSALLGGHPRWIALGDSMTQGIGASAPSRGWVGQLAAQLPEAVDIINLSQSGARVEDVIAAQLPAWRALPPAPRGEIVTVLIGSNDAMSPRHRSLLPEAFAELLEELPRGAIVSTVPSPSGPGREANEIILAAARAGAIRPVTASLDLGEWRGRLAADRFHPNDEGYTMIAAVFADAVGEALSAIPRGDGDRSAG